MPIPIDSQMIYGMAYTNKKRPERRLFAGYLAETQGFEPWIPVLQECALSRGVPSTTRPRLRYYKSMSCNFTADSDLLLANGWPTEESWHLFAYAKVDDKPESQGVRL